MISLTPLHTNLSKSLVLISFSSFHWSGPNLGSPYHLPQYFNIF
jgi:hypothetical protein